jgi:hypothetical protein
MNEKQTTEQQPLAQAVVAQVEQAVRPGAEAGEVAMCDCTLRVNQKLSCTGHQLSMGFSIHPQTNVVSAYLLLRTEKATLPATKKRGACPVVPARFCPFCGQKAA